MRKVVLGARIPTTPSYIIAVTVRAYAPGKLGVPLLAADMFIFYYPVLCDLSTLGRHHRLCRREHAGSEMMSTGIEAFELGMAGFLIPSAFAEIRPKFRFKIQFACSTILVGIEPQLGGKFTPEEIFQYFSMEIFQKTDEETRDFLLKTAFLPKMTGRMAQELTGQPSSARLLSILSRDNYFTVKSFQNESIYQYHPLFRDFLSARARGTAIRFTYLANCGSLYLEKAGRPPDYPLWKGSSLRFQPPMPNGCDGNGV